jgi:retinoid hydroxylase
MAEKLAASERPVASGTRPAANLPGRSGPPLLGETLAFLNDPVRFVERRQDRYGSTFRTRLFGRSTAVLLGSEANRFVLTRGMQYLRWQDGWPPTFPALLGDALFLQDGEEHRRKRNLLMPAFHAQAIESYLSTIEGLLAAQLTHWEGLERFSFYEQFHRLTFEVSSKLFLGCDLGADGSRLNQLINRWVSGLVALPIPLPWTAFGRALSARKELLRYVEKAILDRQRSPRQDALGLLVQFKDEHGQDATIDELKSQALFLVGAGYATTTSLLTYAAYALATNPEVLARARSEQTALGLIGPITLDDVKKMAYLDRVLLEVERLYPPVAFGFRGVSEPFEYEGYSYPKGWQVLYSISRTHQDPANFSDPLRFDPDRFAGDQNERNSFKLVGFGGGPRVCMGMTLARTQAKVVLSRLLRSYEWDLEPKQDLNAVMVPARRPRDGLRVVFRRRRNIGIPE